MQFDIGSIPPSQKEIDAEIKRLDQAVAQTVLRGKVLFCAAFIGAASFIGGALLPFRDWGLIVALAGLLLLMVSAFAMAIREVSLLETNMARRLLEPLSQHLDLCEETLARIESCPNLARYHRQAQALGRELVVAESHLIKERAAEQSQRTACQKLAPC